MNGTLVNTAAIIAGGLIGVSASGYLPERIRNIMIQALGLSVVLVGLKMALFVTDLIVTIGCLLVGAITGELIRIEYWIARLGKWMRVRFKSNSSTFAEGFMSASILYLTGAMMIVGSIQDGTVGDSTTLYVKSLLDGVISIPLASTFGIGVAFSAIPVFLVQGSVTLLASHLLFMQDPDVLNAVTATGGLLIVGIGTNLLKITKIPIGNFLPAIFYAIAWAVFM
ncbi:MAG: DUF554 domain-containing protein [Syntrophobacterales bacterium]|nr:DUF554 domain-containing protein [Syntrophobacterales bacterium]